MSYLRNPNTSTEASQWNAYSLLARIKSFSPGRTIDIFKLTWIKCSYLVCLWYFSFSFLFFLTDIRGNKYSSTYSRIQYRNICCSSLKMNFILYKICMREKKERKKDVCIKIIHRLHHCYEFFSFKISRCFDS